MKTLALILLAVVNLIHCQDPEQMIISTLQGVLEKLEGISEKLKGYEAIQQKQDEIMDKLMGLSRETGQCLRRDDLEHLTNVSAAAHQEIKSYVHEEISGVISLAEKDECSEGIHPCGSRGVCKNSLFSFTCSCPSGFTWDGSDCADIDECVQGKADCSHYASCTNTLGSYSCSCNPHFEGNGRTCYCPHVGFTVNGDICEDIDECAKGKGVCSPNTVCKNNIGSYSCSYNSPFEGDDFQCRSPAKVMNGLGCIKRVDDWKTFREMMDFCQEEGGQLLQNFDAHHLTDMREAYESWVGIYDEKWMSDESLVPEDLWLEEYQSDPLSSCGILRLDYYGSLKVYQVSCSERRFGFCQFQLPENMGSTSL
ncbi:uncharacterized protein [Palaemon carinicauda]|uniref:uncharacterized protein n=1 Tax=Palaemon carinicauda TaxID=392227 RepID=UPI0035B5CD79